MNGYKVKHLFQIILNAPDLWEQAYGNISHNKGGMTPGVDGLTLDGYSHERAANLRALLRENRYVPSPVERVYIPKPNGKQRPLGKPTANDKHVQEVWRMILESTYEPVFKDSSHGFRMKRSCHTALKRIVSTWSGTKWLIEFDIEGFFDHIDHTILMGLLEKKIDDIKFLNVIRRMLKAGYMEDWKYNETYSGTPQGGIISPILANIYLHELDCFVESLITSFERGKARKETTEYRLLQNQTKRLTKKIDQEKDATQRLILLNEKKALQRHKMEIPSVDQHDPDFRRLSYCRYADDFVLGATCPKSEAEAIYRKIEVFLHEELKLKVSPSKSGIKHNTEVMRFLGYDIVVRHTEKTMKVAGRGRRFKKRTMKGIIRLMVPDAKLKSFADKHGYGNWETFVANHNTFLTNASDTEIAMRYSAEMRGIAQYYTLAKNFTTALSKLRILWIRSFLKTMANKHQTSVQNIATMLNRGTYMAVRETGSNGKVRETKLFRLKEVKREAMLYGEVDSPPLTFNYQLQALYQAVLGRAIDDSGWQGYSNALLTSGSGWTLERVRNEIAHSPEAYSRLAGIYQAVLERAMDDSGWQGYANALANGWTLGQVRNDIAHSPEASSDLKAIYQEVWGRSIDSAYLDHYTFLLSIGGTLTDVRADMEALHLQTVVVPVLSSISILLQ